MTNFKKSFVIVITLLMCFMATFQGVEAARGNMQVELNGVFDTGNGTYYHDEKITNIYGQFANYSWYKKDIKNGGPFKADKVLFSRDTIVLNSDMKNVVVISLGDVIVNSNIETVTIFSKGNVTISENSKISEELICFSNNLNLNGSVEKNALMVIKDTTTITGKIHWETRLNTNKLVVSGQDNLLGRVFIETYNKDLIINDKYVSARVKILEPIEKPLISVNDILKNIGTSLIFTVLYIIIHIFSKNKVFSTIYDKAKAHSNFIMLGGLVIFVCIPLVLVFLCFTILWGFGIIALPLLVLFLASMFSISILSAFILGGTLVEIICRKYIKKHETIIRYITSLVIFLILQFLTLIPIAGIWISLLMVIASTSLVTVNMFKKKDSVELKKIR